MRVCFLDTSGWLASVSTRDAKHQLVLDCYQRELEAGTRFITTNLVVAEMQILLTRHRGAIGALRFLDALREDATHSVLYVDAELEQAAIDRWLRNYTDHQFSLADAVSFEVMRREGVTVALGLDSHFLTAGFELLPSPTVK